MRIRKLIFILALLFVQASLSVAQERCATVDLQKLQNRRSETDLKFEQWMKIKKTVSALDHKDDDGTKRTEAAYVIPVVVHVIHNGEGHVSNIPDEQIYSQIRVLNEDFNRLNVDAGQTPAEFVNAAGALDVEFVLAKRTPDGLPTNGINRVQGTKSKWKITDNYELKSLSYWPSEDYLNIWVCDLDSYLGYAQFPQSSELEGLENPSTNPATDGVVIVYDAFGSAEDGNFSLDPKYNKGRTATHEIGHFLGLRHISGDDEGSCGNNGDYVDDTPDQASQTYNCPSHPQASCANTTMFQNFLDYTNDVCMNLFTKGQVQRMRTVLDNSPRRKSLTTSLGATEPQPVANDLGIQNIISPHVGECPGDITPRAEVRNYGSNAVTSAEVGLYREGLLVETKTINGLSVNESEFIEFSPLTISEGFEKYSFKVLETNGVADGNALNNTKERVVWIPSTISTPVSETFDALPDSWITHNPDGAFSWEIVSTSRDGTPGNSLLINFFDYADKEGEIDVVLTPLIDISEVPAAMLLFDVAHARYESSNDGLKVILLSNCNSNINEGTVVYEKYGSALATSGSSNLAFSPTVSSQWRTEVLDLSAYIGQKIQLAFVGINDYGNNMYLDNFRFFTEEFANVTLTSVKSPLSVNCSAEVIPRLAVRNSGSQLFSFDVRYTVNGVTKVEPYEVNLGTGSEIEIELSPVALGTGVNELEFTIENPNGALDLNPADNHRALLSTVNSSTGTVPFRVNFEDDQHDLWTSISPANGLPWQRVANDGEHVLQHPGFSNVKVGSQAWLVSPALDLSATDAATLFFDVAYAMRGNTQDLLELRAATGCDSPFDLVIESYDGQDLSDGAQSTSFKPGKNDWKTEQINLSQVLGSSEVRLAFVVTNNNSNNMFLDNIELFLSSNPTRIDVDGDFVVYPNPTMTFDNASIAFNFPELKDITLEITDNIGKVLFSEKIAGVLNQVVQLPVDDYRNGLYHVRVSYAGKIKSSKLLITR